MGLAGECKVLLTKMRKIEDMYMWAEREGERERIQWGKIVLELPIYVLMTYFEDHLPISVIARIVDDKQKLNPIQFRNLKRNVCTQKKKKKY